MEKKLHFLVAAFEEYVVKSVEEAKSDIRKLKQTCQSILRLGQVQNEVCLPDGIVLPLAEYANVDQLELKLKDSNVSLQ
jgi:hypothetical protein